MDVRTQLQSLLGDGYVIERELGGGMSRVFVAEDKALGRKVVVKVLPPELAAEVNVERFRREIQLAARLQHPNIVPLLNAADKGDLLWYSMPFIDGESLRGRLQREGELPANDVVRILRDVADALAYAHEHGVVHRDIKPENVLLSRGHALVSDFGVAKALSVSAGSETLTATGLVLGTPGYLAPEQAAGDSHVDHRADLYALGCVAYEMLAGHAPFAGRSVPALLAAHVTEVPEAIAKRRPVVSPQLAELVMRLLEKRPADRPQSADEVLRALDALPATSGAGSTVSTGALTPRARVAISRRRLALGGALGLVVIVVAWRGFRRQDRTPEPARRRVAVAPFENLTGDAALDHVGRVAAEWLTQGIVQAESVDVVSSSAVALALRDAKSPPSDVINRLAAATGARLVVTGSVARRGADSLELRAQVVDARTGAVESALTPAAGPTNDPGAAIDATRERLLSALISKDLMVRTLQSAPPKYSAYRELVVGQDLAQRRGDWAAALPYYQRAVALDSTFGLAYNLLALSYVNTGRWDQADTVIQRLGRLRAQLPVLGVLQLDALRALLRGDSEERLRLTKEMAARDSSPISLMLAGATASRMLRPRDAIPALERSDSLMLASGEVLQVVALAAAYHEADSHGAELRTVLKGRRLLPSARLLESQLRAYAGLRNGAAAAALADTILRGITDSFGGETRIVITGALELRAHGDSATAARLLEMVRAWYAAHPVATQRAPRISDEGRMFYLIGQLDSAESRFAVAARDTLNLEAQGYLGLIRARRGDKKGAALIADALGALPRKWMFGTNTAWSGAIVGALGDKARAVELLRHSKEQGAALDTWHYAPQLDALRGYPPFEELIRPQR